jgi:hypothetical protein
VDLIRQVSGRLESYIIESLTTPEYLQTGQWKASILLVEAISLSSFDRSVEGCDSMNQFPDFGFEIKSEYRKPSG